MAVSPRPPRLAPVMPALSRLAPRSRASRPAGSGGVGRVADQGVRPSRVRLLEAIICRDSSGVGAELVNVGRREPVRWALEFHDKVFVLALSRLQCSWQNQVWDRVAAVLPQHRSQHDQLNIFAEKVQVGGEHLGRPVVVTGQRQ